ncbi:MAG: MGMT family protein [Planctomycetaceae bacterium]|nr:MGMT family protein [Planctomycetaceae bacterium]
MLQYAAFSTELGYWGFAGQNQTIHAVVIGHHEEEQAIKALLKKTGETTSSKIKSSDWYPELREQLQQFATGDVVDFSQVKIFFPEKLTRFQRKVLTQTRRLKYGQTASYQELAARAGHPGAARAVGSVMSHNAVPILIPCHRVLGAGGKLGGFSAPRGIALKKDLLKLEDPSCAILV